MSLDPLTRLRRLHKALFDRWTERVKLWAEIGSLFAQGATDSDVAEILGVTGDQVREAKAAGAP